MNGLDLLKRCIPMLLAQDYQNLKIEVIDNGSTDGSMEFLESEFPEVRIINLQENIGLAKARNIGFQSAIEQNADYVLTLDNDTFLANADTINCLVSKILTYKISNIFAYGVRIFEGKNQEILNDGQILFKKQSNKGFHYNELRHKKEVENTLIGLNFVDFVSGCFMLIDVALLKEIGFLDEKYYIYYEEADLCMRAWLKGYASVVIPEIFVHHQKTTTNINWSAFYTYYTIRNFAYFSKKYLHITARRTYFNRLRQKKISIYVLSAFFSAINNWRLISVIKAITLAIKDYKKSQFGKRY